MSINNHVIYFIDEFYSLESQTVQSCFAKINQPERLFSLFYLHDPMHWVYLLEVLPLNELCLIPFTSMDLPTTASLEEIFEALALLHESLQFEKTIIYWFSKQPLDQKWIDRWPFQMIIM